MKNIDESTKNRIMQAALSIFAQEGYRNATVRKICELAQVNVAAINYHFGDKLNLYRYLRYYINENSKQLPLKQEPLTQEETNIEMRMWLSRIFAALRDDQDMTVKHALMIYMREQIENPMANSDDSPIFDNNAPRNQYFYLLESIIKQSLHYDDKELDLQLLLTSVLGLTIFYLTNQDFIRNLTGNPNFIHENEDKIIDLIVNQTISEISILNQQKRGENE